MVSLFVSLTAERNVVLSRKTEETSPLNAQFAILGGVLMGKGTFYSSVGRRDRAFFALQCCNQNQLLLRGLCCLPPSSPLKLHAKLMELQCPHCLGVTQPGGNKCLFLLSLLSSVLPFFKFHTFFQRATFGLFAPNKPCLLLVHNLVPSVLPKKKYAAGAAPV